MISKKESIINLKWVKTWYSWFLKDQKITFHPLNFNSLTGFYVAKTKCLTEFFSSQFGDKVKICYSFLKATEKNNSWKRVWSFKNFSIRFWCDDFAFEAKELFMYQISHLILCLNSNENFWKQFFGLQALQRYKSKCCYIFWIRVESEWSIFHFVGVLGF